MDNGEALITTSVLFGALQGFESRIIAKMEAMMSEKIDNLARLVGKGFADAEGRMTSIEGRMTGMEARMADMDRKIDAVDTHLSAYMTYSDERFDVHDAQLRALEKRGS